MQGSWGDPSTTRAYTVDLNGAALSAAVGEEVISTSLAPVARVGAACVRFLVAPPGELREVLSQGEGTDNRHWFPGWDYPNDRFTVTTAITVPTGLQALGNGALVGVTSADGWTTSTYALERPIPGLAELGERVGLASHANALDENRRRRTRPVRFRDQPREAAGRRKP